MAYVPRSISGAISLAEIDITAQLAQRSARSPDYAAENRALVHLALEMVTHPAHILQTLVDTALTLCRAGTAGLSLLESDNGEAVFRWEAVAGVFADRLNHTMPRDASPCGTTIDRNAPQLMYMPERFFPTLTAVPPVVEALLIPFQVAGTPIGTLWVVAHDERRKFDREDVRLVQTLGQFAAAAWQVWQAQITLARRVEQRTAAWHRARAERRRLQQEVEQAAPFAKLGRLAADVSHEIRNPLGAVSLQVDLLEEELREQAPASVMLVEDTLTDIRTHLAQLEDLGDFLKSFYPSRLLLCTGAALSRRLHSVAMRPPLRLAPAQIAGAIRVNLFAESAIGTVCRSAVSTRMRSAWSRSAL